MHWLYTSIDKRDLLNIKVGTPAINLLLQGVIPEGNLPDLRSRYIFNYHNGK